MTVSAKQISPIADTGGFLQPERIVRNFGLEKGDYAADFGAGHGYYTIPMARLVGGDGKVYAIDIQKSVLDIIRAKAQPEHLLNVETIWGNLDEPAGSKLKDGFIDFVVVSNILFQAEQKDTVIKEAYRVLREGGRLAVIEWDEGIASVGPPANLRVKKEVAKNLALQVGFDFDREFEAGSRHYGLLFIKK